MNWNNNVLIHVQSILVNVQRIMDIRVWNTMVSLKRPHSSEHVNCECVNISLWQREWPIAFEVMKGKGKSILGVFFAMIWSTIELWNVEQKEKAINSSLHNVHTSHKKKQAIVGCTIVKEVGGARKCARVTGTTQHRLLSGPPQSYFKSNLCNYDVSSRNTDKRHI